MDDFTVGGGLIALSGATVCVCVSELSGAAVSGLME